jgi:hypothetical protein
VIGNVGKCLAKIGKDWYNINLCGENTWVKQAKKAKKYLRILLTFGKMPL